MDYFVVLYRSMLFYVLITIIYRFMGKREIGQLGIVDLIVSILIAELAAISIDNREESVFLSILPISLLAIIQIGISYISLKSPKIRNLFDGNPSVIINKGQLNFKEMVKLRYSLDDLVSQLREQGIMNIEDVNYAVLENNGKLSVFKEEKNYPLPLILDGQIDYSVLKEIKKNEKWLNLILEKNNIDLNNVFYAFYTKEKTFIIKKQDVL